MIGNLKRFVLVTGGSKGIGRACVEKYANAGDTVFLTYRYKDESVTSLVDAFDDDQIIAIQSDASDFDSYQDLLSTISQRTSGRLDILVNNVGDAIRRSSFAGSDDDLWVRSLNLNLMTAVRATRLFLPLLQASGKGVVVNMSSIAGTTSGAGDSLHYGVAKAALDTFTKGLAKEMVGGKVRVVGVAPSAIDTDFQERHSSSERVQKIVDQTPIGRIGTADEVANAVLFLTSDDASYISGETLMMTGGR